VAADKAKADNADMVLEKQKSRASARLAVRLRQPSSHARRGGGHSASDAAEALVHGAFMRLKACAVNKPGLDDKQKGRPESRPFRNVCLNKI
jgi:hypothetical protein